MVHADGLVEAARDDLDRGGTCRRLAVGMFF